MAVEAASIPGGAAVDPAREDPAPGLPAGTGSVACYAPVDDPSRYMQNYEKLGVFYLGRYHDPVARQTLPDPVLYDANDLLTHALCVGMTGSGKTGLCLDLIEEAAIDGIPSLLIDPKGDLANLLLTFPELRPEDFAPWVNPDEARQAGRTVAAHAAQQADLWRKGLARWDQDGDRIRRLREAAEFVIYTPGSHTGLPLSILSSFAAPGAAVLADAEVLRERNQSTVGSLLGLLGRDADPTRSREAVFLATLFQQAWQAGRDLDLPALIHEVQTPAFSRVGVMEVETFYPAKDRFVLATALNALLAAPGFDAWLAGDPLDLPRMLYSPSGRPRVAICSIAHLGEAERMFFVTLLLNQVLGWMRTQSGTTSLRALVYMDEIYGYFPPVANPPSKRPLLTLLKQARAFGVGMVLATQNPVDLDYKGLANIGTWFLGRLQTDRDKQRVLDGLEGAAGAQGSAFDRAALEQTLSSLGRRVFLLHNVHEEGAALFESRWCLSYLRGPLSRDQVKTLMDPVRGASGAAPAAPDAGRPARASAAPAAARLAGGARGGPPPEIWSPATPEAGSEVPETADMAAGVPGPDAGAPPDRRLESSRPTLPPGITQFFVPVATSGEGVVYRPTLLGAATVRFVDAKARVDVTQDVVWLTPITDEAVPVDWAEAREVALDPNALERQPVPGARFAPLPAAASQARNFGTWQRDWVNALQASRKLTLLKSTVFNRVSEVGESEGDFRVRLQQTAREQRDALRAKLRARYAPRLATLQDRLRRAEQAVEREASQARQAKLSTALSFGSTLLGAFLGRKVLSASNVNRAGTALRGWGRSAEQAADVDRAQETASALRQQLAELDQQFQSEAATLGSAGDPGGETFQTLELRPTKTGITVKLLTLAWNPGRL